MYDYNVILDYNGADDFLATFTLTAGNLREARRYAQFHKRIYCQYNKPESIPANRIKTTVKRIFKH